MVIEIKYKLYTEGRYHVCRCFRTRPDQLDAGGHFVYTGSATIKDPISETCIKDAIHFLYKLLYTRLLVDPDNHDCSLKEFYPAIQELCKFIQNNSEFPAAGCSRHISGVDQDSQIAVQIFNY